MNDNKLRLVGQPVPVPVDNLDINAEEISLPFEVGYEPEFSIDLAKYEATLYKVDASDKEVNKSIENMQRRFADRVEEEKIGEESFISVQVSQIVEENAEGEHHHHPKFVTISKEQNEAFELVKNLKKDESLKLKKNELSEKEELAKQLNFSKEEVEHLHHEELEVKVSEIYKLNLHELNQELFDKVYGKDVVKSEEELKNKVKTELDEYFQQNADVYFVNKKPIKIK